MDTDQSVVMAQKVDPAAEKLLDRIEKADRAWRAELSRERGAKARRDELIREAHKKGAGYGTIAQRCQCERATIQAVVKGPRS